MQRKMRQFDVEQRDNHSERLTSRARFGNIASGEHETVTGSTIDHAAAFVLGAL
jgi:hypothetical protein